MYVQTENNQVVKYPFDIPELKKQYPTASFPVDIASNEQLLSEFGVYKVTPLQQPEYDKTTQKVISINPVYENGQWIQAWDIVDLEEEEKQYIHDNAAAEARAERNRLLIESDWTQGKDIPDSVSQVWAAYRQALRDITSQEGFPFDVTWPTQP